MRDRRPPTRTKILVLALLAFAVAWRPGAGVAADPAPGPVLHLSNGGYVSGTLAESDRPGRLRWQGSAFAAPFDFDVYNVNAVHWPMTPKPPAPRGEFAFEMAGGDLVYGAMVELNDEAAVLDVPPFGRLHVRRGALLRAVRWRQGAGLVYNGPNGLNGWKPAAENEAGVTGWREESGDLVSEDEGSPIRADVGLPERAVVDVELSWKSRPDFALALGVSDDARTARRAFRVEVWEDDLVVQREGVREADVASLGKVGANPGKTRLRFYLDQARGRLVAFSSEGERVADLKVDGPSATGSGVLLENKRGSVRLERLRVARWDGDEPPESRTDGPGVRLADGSDVPGRVTGYDADAQAFVVRDGEKDETRVPAAKAESVFFASPGNIRPRESRVVLQDGTRLSGDLTRVTKDELWLTIRGIEEPLRVPTASLRSLVALRPEPIGTERLSGTGRLETDGVRLTGRLADAREQTGASCLAWQPAGSATATPLRPGVAGRIIYKEPQQRQTATLRTTLQENNAVRFAAPVGGGVVVRQEIIVRALPGGGVVREVRPNPANPQRVLPPHRRSLYLRTGDVIPSEVAKIDEEGVTFKTPLSDSTFVPHDKVKAVELAPEPPASVRLTRSKRDRLLTLPRVQKGSPPTHLIRSKTGDYLRGRIVAMDDKTLQVEVRLETRSVPRDRVSRIIWLHPDETDPPKPGPAPDSPGGPTRVQAVRSDGIRLTFLADRVADGTLSGKSDVLGACRVRLAEVDQILVGGAIEQEAARLAYQQWKLHNAPEPKVVQDEEAGAAGGRAPGTESALVGKPAPDFALDLLDGKRFRLSEAKGRVVILDFWATWCGPCLQAMPQVDKVAREFEDRGVRLVAVNLQEAPNVISAMLERHNLKMTVALDRDGAVADKYGATAIPQTVVIGPDGNVARLFIGSNPRLGDQLRDALRAVLPGADAKAEKP